jgi:hypothetical protein
MREWIRVYICVGKDTRIVYISRKGELYVSSDSGRTAHYMIDWLNWSIYTQNKEQK